MKKRLMTVFLAICMLLACAGCAKNADSKIQTKSSTSAKKAEITVAGSTAFEPLVKQAVKAMRSSIRPSKSTFWAEVRRQA